MMTKKRNCMPRSAPGPDRIVNFWCKKVNSVHEGVAKSFRAIALSDQEVPLWFKEGKTSLIPKASEFFSENQRPITCLNTIFKWFTSCLLKQVDRHSNVNFTAARRQGAL